MTKTPTVDDILTKFPTRHLNPMRGEPNYDAITALKAELFANAAVIPTPLGGGQHGHIGLVMKQQLYSTLSSTPFVLPEDPGPLPVFDQTLLVTEAARLTIVQEHKEKRRIFDTITNVDLALKVHLLYRFQ